jgi:hypothetical protein|tara:strand:+ start:816 stop:1964 length:1149 start_codon:yes stop_codon:yes gene_type:complete
MKVNKRMLSEAVRRVRKVLQEQDEAPAVAGAEGAAEAEAPQEEPAAEQGGAIPWNLNIAQAPANLGELIFSGQDGPHVQMFADFYQSGAQAAAEAGEEFDALQFVKGKGLKTDPRGEKGDPSRAQFATELAQVAAKQFGDAATLQKRIGEVGAALPEAGMAKSEMPALEKGDVETVADYLDDSDETAIELTPKYTIKGKQFSSWEELKAALGGGKEEAAANRKDEAVLRRWMKLAKLHEDNPAMYPKPGELKKDTPLAKAYLSAGSKGIDGQKGDDKAAVNPNGTMAVSNMVPTQKNVQVAKSLMFALSGGVPKFGGYVFGGPEKYKILDGHHRWSGTYIANPGTQMTNVYQMTAPKGIDSPDFLKAVTALGNAIGRQQKKD